MSNEPFAMVVGPGQVYLAPVGTAFPAIDQPPSGSWGLLGTLGNRNQSEAGIKIVHEQKVTEHFVSGSTGPQKATRQQERLIISGELEDLTLEQYTKLMSGLAIADTPEAAATAGYRTLNIRMGLDVAEFALLVRGASPYANGMNMDWRVPRVYQSTNPSPVLSKAGPAMLAFEFVALEDLDASSEATRYGSIVAQDAFGT